MLFALPEEIWVYIFRFLDFQTLNHTATRVCKSWFHMIRNDFILSGELNIKRFNYDEIPTQEELSAMLSNWKKLKIFKCHNRELSIEFDFKCCQSIKKVICPNHFNEEDFLPPWANLKWISYDPFEKKNESSKWNSKWDRPILPEDGLELQIVCCGDDREPNFCYSSSESIWPLEDIGKEMKNLEKMVIYYLNYNQGSFDFCKTMLKGLKDCQSLEELRIDYSVIASYAADLRVGCNPNFNALTDSILENCPKLTSLEIEKSHQKLMDHQRDKNPLPLAWIKWIPNFKNIEKLVISCTIAPKYGNFEPFFQNPMIKLKSLKLMATGAFLRDLFLINLFEAFPNLQKLDISFSKKEKVIWKAENVVLVLKTLGRVKNLRISNLDLYLERSYDESRNEILYILTKSLEIIQTQFSTDIGNFQIMDDHHGFIILKEKMKSAIIKNQHRINGHTVVNVVLNEEENTVILQLLEQDDIVMSRELAEKISDLFKK